MPPIPKLLASRRGVVSVLAMMFLVLFGSLGVAMAVVSKGNLRTASTHLHVTKAIGAAETGLAVAKARLVEAASRFIISKGAINSDMGPRLWSGGMTSGDGTVTVLPPPSGFSEYSTPAGVAAALVNAHAADQNTIVYGGSPTAPATGSAPSGTDTAVYQGSNWVYTPAVAFDIAATTPGAQPAAFQITYAPLANGTDVRVIVTGYSSISTSGSSYAFAAAGAAGNSTRPITRVLSQDFRFMKQHRHAILSPSKVMIGKNVRVLGNLGGRYTDVNQTGGDPIVVKSDFYGMSTTLDTILNAYYAGVKTYDVDGDNRLRAKHPTEAQGLPSNAADYNGNGSPDNAFVDATGDGYVDDFDLFINFYDANADKRVTLSTALTAGTPAAGQTAEFSSDEDLALQLDSVSPDRNRNGVSGFADANGNGRWDSGETLTDHDATTSPPTDPDRVLGWRDGVIDKRDQYAKVKGRLMFKASQTNWAAANANYKASLKGPIQPESGVSATLFSAPDRELPDMSSIDFTAAATPLRNYATGTFSTQVAAALGVASSALATYTETKTNATLPRYWRADLSNATVKAATGKDLWEKMPFNSPSFADWYIRPRYENMVFKDVQIPAGCNALFVGCTFVGATYVKTYTDNSHVNWSAYGKLQWDAATSTPIPVTTPLDKSDFLRYTSGNVADGPANYNSFPNPPVISGVTKTGAARDTKLYSNNIRFHNCLFVGSIVGDTPTIYTHLRNKLQFTGSTRFTDTHPTSTASSLNPTSAQLPEIKKSSMMMPNYSVDVGQFNAPTDTYTGGPTSQNVNLKGTIVAGVLDVRGNTNIEGTMLLTFAPTLGSGPLQQGGQPVGNPAGFNTTLGYFGPADLDGEGVDPSTLPLYNGKPYVGWDLDGDGIADLDQNATPTAAQMSASPTPVRVPFYGYGRIELKYNPDLPMPDGIPLPVGVTVVAGSYKEGRL